MTPACSAALDPTCAPVRSRRALRPAQGSLTLDDMRVGEDGRARRNCAVRRGGERMRGEWRA